MRLLPSRFPVPLLSRLPGLPGLLGLLGLLGLAGPLAAQAPPGTAATAGALGGTGIQEVPGGLLVGGAGYEARADALGVTFLPVLGAAAPTEQVLRFEARTLERGGEAVAELRPALPRAEGSFVVLERGSGVTERYEVRPEGLALSFVLERPLGRGGDLVVRGRLSGTLAAAARPAGGGLAFEGPWGGVRLGAVTGIDARGRTAPGALRVSGDELELSLPASFVDGAAYPLVLDPLIGASFRIDVSGFDDASPDVAFDSSTSTFLVVWRRTFSASDSDVRGQLLDISGNLVGGTIFFTSGTGTVEPPQVASANYASRFVVVWKLAGAVGDAVIAQLCDPLTGALSGVLGVASGSPGSLSHPDVGSEVLKLPFREALVVWDEGGQGIVGARLDVPLTGDPVLLGGFHVAADVPGFSSVSSPSISKTGGSNGILGVTYLRRAPLIGGDNEVWLALIDRTGVLIDSTALTATPGNEVEPDIDGGSILTTEFLVAWELPSDSEADDLNYTAVRWNGSFQVTGPFTAYESLAGFDDWAVAWTPGKAHVVAAIRPFLFGTDSVSFSAFDTDSGVRCEGPTTVANPTTASGSSVGVGIGSVASGGTYGHGRALLAFTYATLAGDGNVYGHMVDAFGSGSSVVDLGGGCGLGGTMTTTGVPAAGNGFFGLQLAGADPAAAFAVLNVSTPQPTLPCGGCVWLPFQSTSVLPVTAGSAGKFVPVPCDPGLAGLALDSQWTVLTPASSPCSQFLRVSLSNRLRVTLGS